MLAVFYQVNLETSVLCVSEPPDVVINWFTLYLSQSR
jgi:hypothetical protein